MKLLSRVPLIILLGLSVISLPAFSKESAPCERANTLTSAIDCIRENEPAFRDALHGSEEADNLVSSAYRLINPELNVEYLEGKSLGDIQREVTGSLLFTFELGGKRGARAQSFRAEGLGLRADAFDQQIMALTELGGALLRLHQLEKEKAVLAEASETFKKVIRLYRSRGQLPPEQRASLNAFEMIVLGYDRKLLDVDAELLRFRTRTEKLFGPNTKGQPLDASKFVPDLKLAETNLESWITHTPEMLRLRAEQTRSEGDFAAAKADLWPDLKIGPSFKQTTAGAITYQTAGITVAIPIPVLTWNGPQRESRRLTQKRVQSKAKWENQDIRAQYLAVLSQLSRISQLLRESLSEADIQRKHISSEGLFSRGLVGGALVIEAHRAIVEFYETKHSLERQFLEDSLKIQALAKVGGES